jgi:hypothetical protein
MNEGTSLEGRIVTVPEITTPTQQEMFAILGRYFDGYEWSNFQTDLAEKDGVLLLERSGAVKGFTTFKFLSAEIQGRQVRGVFSGDTIVEQECWGQQALSTTWSKYMLDESQRENTPFYWFLISSGYKTYRFLPVFFNEFFPRHDRTTPTFEQAVIDTFATMRFGDMYDPARGTIRFRHSQERLKPGVAEVTETKGANPHVRFFVEKNPYHAEGEELPCLAEVSPTNYKTSALRRFGIEYEQRSRERGQSAPSGL